MIDLINVTKKYETPGGMVTALKGINLHIGRGEIFGVIGLSGAGKSSLVRCINRLEEPSSGQVFIGGTDITKLKGKQLREIRKKTGMIFQHFNLLNNSSVFENIAFPLKISGLPKAEINKRVLELLDVVELEDRKGAYPSQLSGGQKQRVGIARALANNPDIILCDEATSALDPATTGSILKLLKDINRKFGITIVVITHEMEVIKELCSRVAVMESGEIIEEGSVIEIFSNPETEVSRRFLKYTIADLPGGISAFKSLPGERILRISFLGENAQKPFISNMVKKFNIDANIIAGNIESIQETQVGSLILKISGAGGDTASAVNYLIDNNLKVEVLKDGQS